VLDKYHVKYTNGYLCVYAVLVMFYSIVPPVQSAQTPSSESSHASDPLHGPGNALDPGKVTGVDANRALCLIPRLGVDPAPRVIPFLLNLPILQAVLVPLDGIHPNLADHVAVEHDVDLLGMEPRLRVLVPVPLDPYMSVHDQKFDMTRALLEFVVDRANLVFRYVIVDVQILVEFRLEFFVQSMCDSLIMPPLGGQQLPGVVVTQAYDVTYLYLSSTSCKKFREKGHGVEVGRLDED